MDNKYDEQFFIIQSTIDANNKETDKKHTKTNDKLT